MTLLKGLAREHGRAIVIVTQDNRLLEYADRIVLVSRGRLVADGSGSEIKSLASGRTVRATIEDSDIPLDSTLSSLGGVDSVEVRGDQYFIHTKDSDAVARFLLTHTSARDVEITAKGLEEAFVNLTSEGDAA